jgi:hypothetical protein
MFVVVVVVVVVVFGDRDRDRATCLMRQQNPNYRSDIYLSPH